MDYDDHHPTVEDILLIIEIADSTLKSDQDLKGKDYAKSGIKDYWVLDVNNRQLYVYREPTAEGYQIKIILTEKDSISPLEFPDCVINIAQMLRPLF